MQTKNQYSLHLLRMIPFFCGYRGRAPLKQPDSTGYYALFFVVATKLER